MDHLKPAVGVHAQVAAAGGAEVALKGSLAVVRARLVREAAAAVAPRRGGAAGYILWPN